MGLADMARCVPGLGDNVSQAQVSTTTSTATGGTGGSSNITIQPGSGGIMSKDTAPYIIGLAGLGLFGGLLYMAFKR